MDTQLIEEWKQIDRDPDTIRELDAQIASQKLDPRLLSPKNRLQFGTAGLRGELGPGYGCMNSVVVAQTAQGILSYCMQRFPDLTRSNGICVAHDARHKSAYFAELTAGILVAAGVPVHLVAENAPTPYCAFLTQKLGCVAGIMVTASHNPRKYNGYKVYGLCCGVQIVEPTDTEIEAEILRCLEIRPAAWQYQHYITQQYESSGLLTRITQQSPQVEQYHAAIAALAAPEQQRAGLREHQPHVKYSAMWGVGCAAFRRAAADFGLNTAKISYHEPSCVPDPDFGGIERPNPEERSNMLMLATDAGDAELVIANDPDADRVAAMEFDAASGEYYIFHGNELGIVLARYMLEVTQDVPHRCIASSTVSTALVGRIARATGCEFAETLTGLKWIGRQNSKWRAEGKNMVFGFEEAIGYTCGGFGGLVVGDKDGIATACVLIQMASTLRSRGLSIRAYLLQTYEQYGFVAWENGSQDVGSLDAVSRVFARFFEVSDGEQTPEEGSYYSATLKRKYIQKLGEYRVNRIRDLRAPGFDSGASNNVPALPRGESEMLTLYCADVTCTLRPSGTEPKLKYYIESSGTSLDAAKATARKFRAALQALLQ